MAAKAGEKPNIFKDASVLLDWINWPNIFKDASVLFDWIN